MKQSKYDRCYIFGCGGAVSPTMAVAQPGPGVKACFAHRVKKKKT